MTEPHVEDTELLIGDGELLARVRDGDSEAFEELYTRHVGAARGLARQLVRSESEVDDAVAETFARVLALLGRGGGPADGFRAYLLTAVRHVAYDRFRGEKKQVATDDMDVFDSGEPFVDSALAGLERSLIARAYLSLPERWQAVLWYTEIEGIKPAEAATSLGMNPNSVAALAYRAREGLRQAYLQMHLAGGAAEACRPAVSRLGAYVRGGLAKRDTADVDRHLDDCGTCREVYAELMDVNVGLRGIVLPLVAGPAAAGYLAAAGGIPAGVAGWWQRMPKRAPQAAAGGGAVAAAVAAAAFALVSAEEPMEPPEAPPAAAAPPAPEEQPPAPEPPAPPPADPPEGAERPDPPAPADDPPQREVHASALPAELEPEAPADPPEVPEAPAAPPPPQIPDAPEPPEAPDPPEPPSFDPPGLGNPPDPPEPPSFDPPGLGNPPAAPPPFDPPPFDPPGAGQPPAAPPPAGGPPAPPGVGPPVQPPGQGNGGPPGGIAAGHAHRTAVFTGSAGPFAPAGAEPVPAAAGADRPCAAQGSAAASAAGSAHAVAGRAAPPAWGDMRSASDRRWRGGVQSRADLARLWPGLSAGPVPDADRTGSVVIAPADQRTGRGGVAWIAARYS
ncbi:sigma-70 family RNA polymerase sigma factor [Streptomonospora wellingtoniae]|uniref:Sigma-70 family RNA polymerase sigma factor n=1 Tax=Streptomonospora wellingtoniae TaxID=3075544 RepID=A0ABU2KRA9_9ACTN|nr:sigma-70 family RNA polymerase sigma factor [Streptomonospora sp. DSM 45055]MDT0301819.1 sigma-70 family RNA polymerase sigma factor [Streptomonospora sp. DSM 45055]